MESLPRASDRLTTTRSTSRSFTMAGMSDTTPMIPGLISDMPTRLRSVSTKPTSSTPISRRRVKSSRASSTAAGLVPTMRSRSTGWRCPASQSNANRHPAMSTTKSTAAMANTPRPITRLGVQ